MMAEPRPPRRFTRPRRRLLFGVLLALGWLPVQLLLWGAVRETYTANPPANGPPVPNATTSIGTMETTFGLFLFAIRTRTNIVAGGPPLPGTPAPVTTWDVRPHRLASTAVVSLALVAVAWRMVIVLARLGELRGHCDACGYDLVVVTSARCPECGTRIKESSSA